MKFIEIKWFNPQELRWVADYTNDKCVLSISQTAGEADYSFYIHQSLGADIFQLLNQLVNEIRKRENKELVEIINLHLESKNNFIVGKFELLNKC